MSWDKAYASLPSGLTELEQYGIRYPNGERILWGDPMNKSMVEVPTIELAHTRSNSEGKFYLAPDQERMGESFIFKGLAERYSAKLVQLGTSGKLTLVHRTLTIVGSSIEAVPEPQVDLDGNF